MGTIATAFTAAFRDFNTDGVPASGAHQVAKADCRALGTAIETYTGFEGRIVLTGNQTLYVSPTGNDANPGTVGSPFLTIQHAINVAQQAYDCAGFTMTIQLADGLYTAGGALTGAMVGQVEIIIAGNDGAPGNVTVQVGAGQACFFAKDYGAISIHGMTLTSAGGFGINVAQFGIIDYYNVIFGTMPGGTHIQCSQLGSVNATSGYEIAGGASFHIALQSGGASFNSTAIPQLHSSIVILPGVAFTGCFLSISGQSLAVLGAVAFAGPLNATGIRWQMFGGGLMDFGGQDPNSLPGSTNGDFSTGGGFASRYFCPGKGTLSAAPAGATNGAVMFISDGRKVGEGGGAGTGVLACYSNGNWRRLEDDTVVVN